MSSRILVVEDDEGIARVITDNLIYEGFDVRWAATGRDAVRLMKEFGPDLVLLDLMLPNSVDGFELCRRITEGPHRTPVIMITARGQLDDRIRGFAVGADDYVVKPFVLDELLARVRAVLRRTGHELKRLTVGDIVIDFVARRAMTGRREITFTEREFGILRYLGERVGKTVSRDELLTVVWGYSDVPTTRTVDQFIFQLRRKLEPDPHHPKYLRTSYGDGYLLAIDDEDLEP
jgi:DNA-binding response OmpR family regulator